MKIKFFFSLAILLSCILLLSSKPNLTSVYSPAGHHDTISDIDGNEIYTVIIGKQEWTVHNLNTEHFRNGDAIVQAITEDEWIKAGKEKRPAWCYFDGKKPSNRFVGKLYNFYAITDPRGIAPEGWKVPSLNEWNEMITTLGGPNIAGPKLKFSFGWLGENTGGTNSSGFRAFPGGYRMGGYFFHNRDVANWWIAPDDANASPSCIELYSGSSPMRIESGLTPNYGASIRCIKE